nr:glycosyltransferase [Paenibacillus shirakamiensis]
MSEGFGSGHTQAAYAIAAGMKKISPRIQTKVLELGSFLNPMVAPLILSAYRKTVTTSPALVGLLYKKKYEKRMTRLTRLALHKIFYTQTAEVIRHLQPDLIICTHPIPSAVVAHLKSTGLSIPLYTVITDYDAHASWINAEADRYLVSTPQVRRLLLERGIESRAIQITGIPVHPNFWTIQNKEHVRLELGLKHMPTVLIMGGGWGMLFKKNILDRMTAWSNQIQLVFCVGTNTRLADKLHDHPAFRHPHIIVLGHTKEISKWMDASDLLITKPGGMTCTEGLAKGIPMLLCESIPGQEESNKNYFIASGFGQSLSSEEEIDLWFQRLIQTATHSETLQNSSASSHNTYEPDLCARNLVSMLYSSSNFSRKVPLSSDESVWTQVGV